MQCVCVCVCVCVSADWYEEFDKEDNTLNCNHQNVVCLYFLCMSCTLFLALKDLI